MESSTHDSYYPFVILRWIAINAKHNNKFADSIHNMEIFVKLNSKNI